MATINATNTSNPISVAQGGTGAITQTIHGVLLGNTTGAITATAAGTNGQLLCGSTGVAPVFTTLTSTGGTITFSPGAGTLNLSTTAQPSITWSIVTGTTQAAAANAGYIANNAGLVTVTLIAAASAVVGTKLRVTGVNNATGWKIAQNASQQIFFGTTNTTGGVGGSLASSATRDSVELVCVTADGLLWNVVSAVGNITVV